MAIEHINVTVDGACHRYASSWKTI